MNTAASDGIYRNLCGIGCPSDIEVLLHFHCVLEPHPRADAPAVMGAVGKFVRMGCLRADATNPSGYQTTVRGKAWVRALCNVPAPRAVWVDDHCRVLAHAEALEFPDATP